MMQKDEEDGTWELLDMQMGTQMEAEPDTETELEPETIREMEEIKMSDKAEQTKYEVQEDAPVAPNRSLLQRKRSTAFL